MHIRVKLKKKKRQWDLPFFFLFCTFIARTNCWSGRLSASTSSTVCLRCRSRWGWWRQWMRQLSVPLSLDDGGRREERVVESWCYLLPAYIPRAQTLFAWENEPLASDATPSCDHLMRCTAHGPASRTRTLRLCASRRKMLSQTSQTWKPQSRSKSKQKSKIRSAICVARAHYRSEKICIRYCKK